MFLSRLLRGRSECPLPPLLFTAKRGEGGKERCNDIALLAVLGGRPTTDAGRQLHSSHIAGCDICYAPGWGPLYIDSHVEQTPENTAHLEKVFGPIDWS